MATLPKRRHTIYQPRPQYNYAPAAPAGFPQQVQQPQYKLQHVGRPRSAEPTYGDFEDDDDEDMYPNPQYQGGYIPGKNYYVDPSKQAWPYVSPYQPQPPLQDPRDFYASIPAYATPRVVQRPLEPIHTLLATTEDRHRNTPLTDIMVWDVRYKDALTAEDTPVSKHALRMFAFNPPVTKAVLYCKELPWAVKVENPEGIKVADVMKRIHDELAEALTEAEWWIFDSKDRTAMSKACNGAIALGVRKETEGVRRVDRLGPKHILDGVRKPATTADQDLIKQRTFNRKKEGEHHYILEFRKEDK